MDHNLPIFDKRLRDHRGYGLIQVFTGDGKGKTTAALGEAMRVIGDGRRAVILFFDKGGEHYAERKILEKLGVEWRAFGRDRVDFKTGRFDFSLTDQDRALAAQGLAAAREILASERRDLIVLDEINSCCSLGLLEERSVLELLRNKPAETEIILTGRNAPDSFIEEANLVTEMKLVKHYFYSGVKARSGLDF